MTLGERINASPQASSGAIVRPLGTIETWMVVQQRLGAGTTQGSKVITLAGRVDFSALVAGARGLFGHFRLLRCSVGRSESVYYFNEDVDFEDIEVEQHQVANDSDGLRQAMEEVHRPLDASRGLWRLCLLSHSQMRHWVVLTCHHAILDEESGHLLANALMRACDEPGADFLPSARPADAPRALDDFLLPQESCLPGAPLPRYPIPYREPAPLSLRRTHFNFKPVRAEVVAHVAARSEKWRLSENALFCASLTLAAYKSGVVEGPINFKSALSLREFAYQQGAQRGGLGCYIGVADMVLDPSSQDVFTLATRYQNSLLAEAYATAIVRQPLTMEAIEAAISAQLQSDCFGGFGLTNLGALDVTGKFTNFEVVDSCALTNRQLGNLAFAAQLYTFGGRMSISYQHVVPLMPDHDIEAIHIAFIKELEALRPSDAEGAGS